MTVNLALMKIRQLKKDIWVKWIILQSLSVLLWWGYIKYINYPEFLSMLNPFFLLGFWLLSSTVFISLAFLPLFKKIENQREQILRLQINPHFIFNTLNSIAEYIRANRTDDADYYLSKYAKLMRIILEKTTQKYISLHEEIEIMELYIKLESIRLNHSFIYEITIPPQIDTKKIMIPPLLLQPFVENSIWHGINKKPNGKIVIEISTKGENLSCSISDNGYGIIHQYSPDLKNKRSKGLSITTERIKYTYKSFFSLKKPISIRSNQKGFQVLFQFPIKKSNYDSSLTY